MLEPTQATDHVSGGTPPPRAMPVVVGTPEWDELTARRVVLIRKDIRGGGLTSTERAELDRLDALSLAATTAAFPPPAWVEKLHEIEKRLATTEGRPPQ